FLFRYPAGTPDPDAVEALADALDLAALHRQKHVGGGRESAHQLELGADQLVERLRIRARAGAGTGVAYDQLRPQEVLHGFDRGGVVGDADVGLLRRRADPGQPGRIEAGAGRAGERPERRVAGDDAERGAVLGRDVVEVARGDIAAGARHVLRDHGGI